MTWYMCKICRYRFETEMEKSRKKCPYCGEGEIMGEPNADELLVDEE